MWLFQRLIGMSRTQRLSLTGYPNTHTAICLLLLLCYGGHQGICEASLGSLKIQDQVALCSQIPLTMGISPSLGVGRLGQSPFTEAPPICKLCVSLLTVFSFSSLLQPIYGVFI